MGISEFIETSYVGVRKHVGPPERYAHGCPPTQNGSSAVSFGGQLEGQNMCREVLDLHLE